MAFKEKEGVVAVGVEHREEKKEKEKKAKPLPNYLKPTISSVVHQTTCRPTANHHLSPPGRRPTPGVSLRKSPAPRESEKLLAAAPSLRKARTLPEARERSSKLAGDIAQGNSDKPRRARARSMSSTAVEVPAARRPAVAKKSATKEEGKGDAKEQQQPPQPADDGEAAAAVGNEVKTLAGELETVISMDEPEARQPGQHHGEAAPVANVVGEGQPGQQFQEEESKDKPRVEVMEEAGDLVEAADKNGLTTESNQLTGGAGGELSNY